MTGMQTVIELRRSGYKPAAVYVDLVQSIGKFDGELYCFAEHTGIVSINIAATESLTEIDFRPLAGLTVHVYDNADDPVRHTRAAKLLAEVEPFLLVVPMARDDNWILHRRFAGDPPATDRTVL